MSRRESSAGEKPPSGAPGSNKIPDRPSRQAAPPGAPPMQRMSSMSRRGGNAPGVRNSRRSSRRSQLGTAGEGQQRKLEPITIDGETRDRTPKPLISTGAGPVPHPGPTQDDLGSPTSETSEFFMDRMSTAGFSARGGWGSESNAGSGSSTPRTQETGDLIDAAEASKRERAKAMAAATAAAGAIVQAEEEEAQASMAKAKQKDAELVALRPHHILTEKDLAKSMSIVLQETQTDFMLEIPSVTVAGDSEEAKVVEEANRRYSKLLAAKISTDRYADSETQTLELLKKSREVQSRVMSTATTECQATRWDIADAAAESSRSKAMQENALGGDLPSVGELAGGVARGAAYAGAQIGSGGGGGQGSSFMSQSGGMPRGSTQSGMMRQESMSSNARGSVAGPSWAQPSMMAAPPGAPPSTAANTASANPEGAAGGANIGVPEPAPNPLAPLLRKPAFREALAVMDAALAQNEHQPQLLLYRNITPQTSSVAAPVPPTLKNMSEKENLVNSTHSRTNAQSRALSRAQSRVPSRPSSRQGSEAGSVVVGEAAAKLQRSLPQRLAGAGSGSIGANSHGGSAQNQHQRESMSQAPSVAESHWPEELLQDLADLGPDGAPALEHLWDWTCPLTEGKQVACMAWNKAIPDLLAVGYGSLNFHKEGGTGTTKDKDGNQRDSKDKDTAPGAKADAKPTTASAPTNNNNNANATDTVNGANKSEAQNGVPGSSAAAAGKGAGGAEANGGQKENGEAPPAAASHGGLVAFWSLKNPGFPLWWFETLSGVTALDFSTSAPNILALGLYSGAVAVYDVKQRQGTPSMESDAATGKHSDPVWKVKWIDRGPEHDEPLVSISTDGRVTQWSIAKGLEYTDLMKLKRVPRKNTGALPSILTGPPSSTLNNTGGGGGGPNSGAGGTTSGTGGKAGAKQPNPGAQKGGSDGGEAFISRLTSGMAFDFSARDERVYIVGTEDGWVHRCSTSYNEQYLESYAAHMGPVYSLQWSPFRKDMFISCSADWTLKMWQEGREQPLLTFQSHTHEVNDVQWCPTNSTVFGSATSGGRLEIWDFDLSTVKPVVTHKAGVKLSCLLFSPTCPVVVCGSETGRVSVFRLFNVDREYDLPEDQLSRLEEVIRTNVMKAQPGAAV